MDMSATASHADVSVVNVVVPIVVVSVIVVVVIVVVVVDFVGIEDSDTLFCCCFCVDDVVLTQNSMREDTQ